MLTPITSFSFINLHPLGRSLITFRFESVVDSSTTGTWSLSFSFDGLSTRRCNARSEARLSSGDKSPASGRSDLASWFMHMVTRIQNTDFLNDGWFLAVASEVYNEIVLVLCAATLFGVLRNIRGFEIM